MMRTFLAAAALSATASASYADIYVYDIEVLHHVGIWKAIAYKHNGYGGCRVEAKFSPVEYLSLSYHEDDPHMMLTISLRDFQDWSEVAGPVTDVTFIHGGVSEDAQFDPIGWTFALSTTVDTASMQRTPRIGAELAVPEGLEFAEWFLEPEWEHIRATFHDLFDEGEPVERYYRGQWSAALAMKSFISCAKWYGAEGYGKVDWSK